MGWTNAPPVLELAAEILGLRLRAERLKVASNLHGLAAQARALGVPEDAVRTALRGKPAAPATYELPPLRHLEVRSRGEF